MKTLTFIQKTINHTKHLAQNAVVVVMEHPSINIRRQLLVWVAVVTPLSLSRSQFALRRARVGGTLRLLRLPLHLLLPIGVRLIGPCIPVATLSERKAKTGRRDSKIGRPSHQVIRLPMANHPFLGVLAAQTRTQRHGAVYLQ